MKTQSKMSTIQCPRCQQTLPGWAQTCQFCGVTITPGYVLPVDAYKYKVDNRMSWTEVAYVVVSVIIILQGVYNLLQGFNIVPNVFYSVGGGTFIAVIGTIDVILGVGMLLHQTWAQFIVKLCAILGVVFSGFSVLQALMFMGHLKHAGAILASNLWTTIVMGFAIYLINVEGDV